MIEENYRRIKERIGETATKVGREPAEITLVAVTKGHSLDDLRILYDSGVRHLGENRLQEASDKMSQTPSDIQWHFIGSLQKNKVRKAVGRFALIHAVDSVELAKKISDISHELAIVTPILIQVNTSKEVSKHGLSSDEWQKNLEALLSMPGVSLQGLMTMAPFTDDEKAIRKCFAALRHLRDNLQRDSDPALFQHLSMGMSNDFESAIAEGATLLRIGTAFWAQ